MAASAVVAPLSASLGAPLGAQERLGPERQDIRNFGGDIWAAFTSPVHMSGTDAAVGLGGIALVAVVSRADSAVWEWMNGNPHALPLRAISPIREGFRYHLYEMGSGQYILPLSGVLYTAGRLSHDAGLRDAGLGCATGHLSSLGLREIAYHVVARDRPRDTDDPYRIDVPGRHQWSWQSFFSGHTANSMACASFIGHRYSLGVFEAVPYAYSLAIGFGRMADGRHWFSDTVTGALVGFALGREIADRQLHRIGKPTKTLTGAPPGAPLNARGSIPLFSWSITF
ncbi:MAG TPA: phosphatase PAP2 family protein [Gemmatimonadaceae bacterium]